MTCTPFRGSGGLASLGALVIACGQPGIALAQASPLPQTPRVMPNTPPAAAPAFANPGAFSESAPQPAADVSDSASNATAQVDQLGFTFNLNATAPLQGQTGSRDTAGHAEGETCRQSQVAAVPLELRDTCWVSARLEQLVVPRTRQGAINALQQLNQEILAAGYINSGVIPAVDDGSSADTVNLILVRGRLLKGAEIYRQDDQSGLALPKSDPMAAYVTDRLPSAGRSPLNTLSLEKEFRLLADDPAIRTVHARLEPSQTRGIATLAVEVDRQPTYDLYTDIASSRSPSIGGDRAAVGASARNWVRFGSLATAEIGTTAGASDYTISYAIPITTRISAHARVSGDQAGVLDQTVRDLDIRARDNDADAGLSVTLFAVPASPDNQPGRTGYWHAAQSLTAGLDVERRTSATTLLGGEPFSFAPGAVDGKSRYSVRRVSAEYLFRQLVQTLSVSATASFGHNGTGSDLLGVQTPDPHFRTVQLQVSYAHLFWEQRGELRVRATSQSSDALLYSGEKYSVGGAYSVRGYRENVLLADAGTTASVAFGCTLRFFEAPCAPRPNHWDTFKGFVFADAASIHNHFAPQPAPTHIASVGVSLEWQPSPRFSAVATLAAPLEKVPGLKKVDLQDRGIDFEMIYRPFRW